MSFTEVFGSNHALSFVTLGSTELAQNENKTRKTYQTLSKSCKFDHLFFSAFGLSDYDNRSCQKDFAIAIATWASDR